MNEKIKPPPPLSSDIYLNTPLYEEIDLNSFEEEEAIFFLLDLEVSLNTIDAYCVECKKQSTFKREVLQGTPPRSNINPKAVSDQVFANRSFSVHLSCARDVKHEIFFHFLLKSKRLIKVGQYPSIATLSTPDIRQYRKVLGEEKLKELHRAIGLVSHGVGIGAFVYLRRIFEGLIDEAHSEAQHDPAWEDESYHQARMDEKIEFLKDYLPEFLVENRKLYSILSTGIHSLTEDECLQHFDIVRVGIELIMDEQLAELRKQEKISQAKKAINSTHQSLKN